MGSFEPIIGRKGSAAMDFSYGFPQGGSDLLSHFPVIKSVSLESPEAA